MCVGIGGAEAGCSLAGHPESLLDPINVFGRMVSIVKYVLFIHGLCSVM